VWNRWVNTMERNQPHKTPVTSTWTVDFLTRGGKGRKTVGDWLRDKTISWKTRRRLLQTNASVFPCEARLQKWGKHPDGICEVWKRCREMGLKLLGGRPAPVPLVICRAVCAAFRIHKIELKNWRASWHPSGTGELYNSYSFSVTTFSVRTDPHTAPPYSPCCWLVTSNQRKKYTSG
jgi:hypothetical protein